MTLPHRLSKSCTPQELESYTRDGWTLRQVVRHTVMKEEYEDQLQENPHGGARWTNRIRVAGSWCNGLKHHALVVTHAGPTEDGEIKNGVTMKFDTEGILWTLDWEDLKKAVREIANERGEPYP